MTILWQLRITKIPYGSFIKVKEYLVKKLYVLPPLEIDEQYKYFIKMNIL